MGLPAELRGASNREITNPDWRNHVANFIVSRYSQNSTPALSTATGIVVGQLGVPFPPDVSTPGNRRGVISFHNFGSGSVFVAPLGPNLLDASQFTSSTQGIELPAGLTLLSRLECFNSDDVWAALSGTGAGDNLIVLESS
jgi:hypothetical protein